MTMFLQFLLATCTFTSIILALLLASTGDITGACMMLILTACTGVSFAFLDL